MLSFTRRLLDWRRGHDFLRIASEQVLDDLPDNVIGVRREHRRERLLCYANFSLKPAKVTLPDAAVAAAFSTGESTLDGDTLTLGPLAALALTPCPETDETERTP